MIDMELFRGRLLIAFAMIAYVFFTRNASAQIWSNSGIPPQPGLGSTEVAMYFTPVVSGTYRVQPIGPSGSPWGSKVNLGAVSGGVRRTYITWSGVTAGSYSNYNREGTAEKFEGGTWVPYPPPIPDPVSTDIVIDGITGGVASLYVDENGDGILDYIGDFPVDAAGQGEMPYESLWNGRPYEVRMKTIEANGVTVPYSQLMGTGTFATGGVSVSGTLGVEHIGNAGTISIGPEGAIETAELVVNEIEANGTAQTAYTYNNGAGESTSITYSTSGGSGVTAADIRLAAAQNSAQNAQIVAGLKEIAAKLPGTVTTGTIAVPSGPDLPGDLDESQGEAITEKVLDGTEKASAIVDGAKVAIVSAPSISASVGTSLTYTCTLPVLGEMVLNLGPYSTFIGHFRDFLKFVLSLVAWAVLIRIFRGTFV